MVGHQSSSCGFAALSMVRLIKTLVTFLGHFETRLQTWAFVIPVFTMDWNLGQHPSRTQESDDNPEEHEHSQLRIESECWNESKHFLIQHLSHQTPQWTLCWFFFTQSDGQLLSNFFGLFAKTSIETATWQFLCPWYGRTTQFLCFFLIACLTGIDGKFRKSGSGPWQMFEWLHPSVVRKPCKWFDVFVNWHWHWISVDQI